MKRNRAALRRLMAGHDLKGPEVASMLGKADITIREYMSKTGNDIPDSELERLKQKLGKK